MNIKNMPKLTRCLWLIIIKKLSELGKFGLKYFFKMITNYFFTGVFVDYIFICFAHVLTVRVAVFVGSRRPPHFCLRVYRCVRTCKFLNGLGIIKFMLLKYNILESHK